MIHYANTPKIFGYRPLLVNWYVSIIYILVSDDTFHIDIYVK